MKKERSTLQGLRDRLSQVIGSRDADEKKFRREAEIRELEDEIRRTEEQEQEEQKKAWTIRLDAEAARVGALLEKKQGLLNEVAMIDVEIATIRETVLSEIPKRWKQTGSSHGVIMIEKIKAPVNTYPIFDSANDLALVGVPKEYKTEYEDVTREHIIPAIPEFIAKLEAKGLTLKEGEKVVPEELDWDNAIPEPICVVPDVLQTGIVTFQFRPNK